MPNKYYYLISSLPYLNFGKDSPITIETFLTECEKWLKPADLKKLASADADSFEADPQDSKGVREWKEFNLNLYKDLADVRQAKALAAQHIPHSFFQEVFSEPTPLLSEIKIERIRWAFIDETEPDYHFDITELIFYYIKLKVLERLAVFNKEEGKKKFESLCEVHYG